MSQVGCSTVERHELGQLVGGTTIGQGIFMIGFILFIAAMPVMFFGCPRWIDSFICVDSAGNNSFNLAGLATAGSGLLMLTIGWLVMKEEHIEEPKP